MERSNNRLSRSEESLLKSMIGQRLESIDAVLAAPPDSSWNAVRLHFEGLDVDINNSLSELVVDELGTLEEFGLLSVSESNRELLSIPAVGADTSVFEIGDVVTGVSVINNVIGIYGEGDLVAKIEYPQAIALHMGSGIILLDKEVWFSEMIVIKRGQSIDELLYDESVNWQDNPDEDPTTHFDFRVERQEF